MDGMAERAHLREAAPLLVTRELTKSFRSLVALRNHHIEVRAGEVVGVIGPNGSGKSTFFNLVTGFLKPNTGVVEFAGAPIQNLAAPAIVRLGIARTFHGTRPRARSPMCTQGYKGITGSISYQPGSRVPQKTVSLIGVKDEKLYLADEVTPNWIAAP